MKHYNMNVESILQDKINPQNINPLKPHPLGPSSPTPPHIFPPTNAMEEHLGGHYYFFTYLRVLQ